MIHLTFFFGFVVTIVLPVHAASSLAPTGTALAVDASPLLQEQLEK